MINGLVFLSTLGVGSLGKVKLAELYDDPEQKFVTITHSLKLIRR
jgi:hypothetical protein